jgi:hypothetical protein
MDAWTLIQKTEYYGITIPEKAIIAVAQRYREKGGQGPGLDWSAGQRFCAPPKNIQRLQQPPSAERMPGRGGNHSRMRSGRT